MLQMATEEPIIRDNVNDFSNDEQQHDFDEHGEPTNQSESSSYFETISSQFSENQEYSNPYQRTTSVNTNDFYEGLTFESKQAVVNAIKQFHFMHSFNFDVVKNKSDNYLSIWFTAAQHFVPSTIVKYKTSSSMEEGDDNPPRVILNRVFWSFNPCIKGFKYCKTLVQVDETFLTGKYHGTLLTSIGQDGSRNYFPLAFEIVESETKEAWMWFLHYLRRYVTLQPNCVLYQTGEPVC
ncbi:hypothetical protein HKD37_14G040964 [Glycine soja]